MEIIADIFLAAGALGAGLYCIVLSRRLARFTDLESGMGGAVAVLSAQVDDLHKTLAKAQQTAGDSTASLSDATARAEEVSRRLELLMASTHDLEQTSKSRPDTTRADPIFVRHAKAEAGQK